MKLTGTKTTPSRAVANDKTTNCQQLCDSSASRPPFFRPLAARAAAVSDTAASSSANVSRVSPPTMASLPGLWWCRGPGCERGEPVLAERGEPVLAGGSG